MDPKNSDLLDAALPFLLPWKTLNPNLTVVALDAASLECCADLVLHDVAVHPYATQDVPMQTCVAIGLTHLDTSTPACFEDWSHMACSALESGGILVMGGQNREHPNAVSLPGTSQSLLPDTAADILQTVGFARTRILRPETAPEEFAEHPPVASSLYQMSPRYAIVAQAPAFGAEFDIFSPAFHAPVGPSPAERARTADAQLHAKLEMLANENRTLRSELVSANADIHRLEARVNRATRRRGLRKLFHSVKKRLPSAEMSLPHKANGLPDGRGDESLATHSNNTAIPDPTKDIDPLSMRERAVRAQIVDT